MPAVDMNLEKLKEYTGSNPRPLDFDDYWDSALEEMHSVNADVELVPADFQVPCAECFDLWFTGVRGARIHAKYLRPRNIKSKHPAILHFHGYSGNSGEWCEKLGYVAMGFSVASLDCRGQGGLSEDTGSVKGSTFKGHIVRGIDDEPENLLFRQIFLDTAQLAGIIMNMPEVAYDRVGAMGGSQGGGLTLACAALEPRLKQAAPYISFLSDYKRIWEMDLAKDSYEELKFYFRKFDPTHSHEDEIFTKLGYIDVQHLAARINAQVLMGVGLMDTICPPSTQFAAYNKITAKKEVIIYPDFGHEALPGFYDRTLQFMATL